MLNPVSIGEGGGGSDREENGWGRFKRLSVNPIFKDHSSMLISQYCRYFKRNKFSAFLSHFCGNVNCQSTSAHLNIQA